jgi:hypothetical protein
MSRFDGESKFGRDFFFMTTPFVPVGRQAEPNRTQQLALVRIVCNKASVACTAPIFDVAGELGLPDDFPRGRPLRGVKRLI